MNIRQIALRILDEYEAGGKFINLALSTHLTDKLSREEKAALTALLYTSVEKKLTYDYYICALSKRSESDIDPHTKNILRLGLCQIIDMHSVPDFAAVNESVKLASTPGERSFVNGVLRAAVRQKNDLPMPPEAKNYRRYLSVKYSFPLATVKHFDALYGRENTEKILEFFNNEKYTDITVNTLKISIPEFISLLKTEGYKAKENTVCENSLRINASVNPERLPGFEEGYFFVQDRASAIACSLLSPGENDLIVDVCSAPGGKSFSAAINGGGKVKINSFDIHSSKLSLISSGANRLGITCIEIDERDALLPDENLIGKADRVICDAPCSGLGVLSKKPDLRYKDISDTDSLSELQYNILKASSSYLKNGGYIVYSTCTLNPKENENVVLKFIEENSDFELVPFAIGELSSENGMLTLIPHISRTDGFFMAKIRRKNQEMTTKVDLLSLLPTELEEYFVSIGEPKFRAKQVFARLHKGEHISEITNLSKILRERLSEATIDTLPEVEEKLVSKIDGTVKYLFRLHDGACIESVFMKYKHGNTLCISSQVGCRMGCKFCASTIGGRVRDLFPSELLGQVIAAEKDSGERISNIVMMGIGEPLDNYDNVIKFLRLVNHPDGLNIGYRHISLSTCGVVDGINRLATVDIPITLSISLHAANDMRRSEIMPINNKWNISALLSACVSYYKTTGRRISFEYTLISGKNDSEADANELATLLNSYFRPIGAPIHVNLIRVNEVKETGFKKGSNESVNAFASTLEKRGITATVRRKLGSDVNAACGQLRRSNLNKKEEK